MGIIFLLLICTVKKIGCVNYVVKNIVVLEWRQMECCSVNSGSIAEVAFMYPPNLYIFFLIPYGEICYGVCGIVIANIFLVGGLTFWCRNYFFF